MTKAIVLGATGLVGSEMVAQLAGDQTFSEVLCLVRREPAGDPWDHPKVRTRVVDFDAPETFEEAVKGDVLFSAMGTTLKSAGSKEAQWRVDYDYQHEVAAAASRAKVPVLVLISSTGANAGSPFFYLSTKGKLEEALGALPFKERIYLRPSTLGGERKDKRALEGVGITVQSLLPRWKSLRSWRVVPARHVAGAAIALAKAGLHSLENNRTRVIAAADIWEHAPGAGD